MTLKQKRKRKNLNKPGARFKKTRRKIRRAKIKDKLRMGADPEKFRKEDVWEYL